MKIITLQKIIEVISDKLAVVEIVALGDFHPDLHKVGETFQMHTDRMPPVQVGDLILVTIKEECAEYFKLEKIGDTSKKE